MMISLFFIWVLSLLFYQFSIFGTFSVGNLLAPFLFVVWLVNSGLRGQSIPACHVKNIKFKTVTKFNYLTQEVTMQ